MHASMNRLEWFIMEVKSVVLVPGDKMLLLDTKDLVLLGRMNKVWSHLSESSTGQSMLLWGLSPNPFLFRYTPALSLVFLL